MTTSETLRHVLLLRTDERAGLVAAIARSCADRNISLEITTGPGHVLITATTSQDSIDALRTDFLAIPGVEDVHTYEVAASTAG